MRRYSTATYAVPALVCDASIDEIIARRGAGMPAMLTSFQVRPVSRVTWMSPLLVPAQITPGMTVEAASDSIAPRPPSVRAAVAESMPAGMPRSGLIAVQVAPPLVVLATYCRPAKSCRLFQGAQSSGCDEVVRALVAGSAAGLTFIDCSLG